MPCQEPLFPGPHAPKVRPVLQGDSGVAPGTCHLPGSGVCTPARCLASER